MSIRTDYRDTEIKEIQFREGNDLLSMDLFPGFCRLELNVAFRIISVIRLDDPHILAQQQLTKNEWSIFLTLLSNYPHFTSYESLLACLTSLSLSDCRKRIQEAQEKSAEELKRELKPVHRALSGIRTKLNCSLPQVKVSFIRDLGYLLVIDSPDNGKGTKSALRFNGSSALDTLSWHPGQEDIGK